MTERGWSLAIDFGTSYTVAAVTTDGRAPEVIEIDGDRRVPSVVLVQDDGTLLVGRLAEELSSTNPERTVRAPKGRLGDQAPVVINGRPYQVVTLVSAVFAHVAREAIAQQGSPPNDVRLTHPATWNRAWLNRLEEAAAKAGLGDVTLVPEPVAAALSFSGGNQVPPGSYAAVYDLGGGTFDTAVVLAEADGFAVVGRPGGDPRTGGELFDEIMGQLIGEQLPPATWEQIQVGGDWHWQRVAAALRHESRRAKESLSVNPWADLLLPLPDGLTQLRVTRDDYEAAIRPHIADTMDILGRTIANAGLQPRDLAGIYLVGGASRTPLVSQLAEQTFPGTELRRRGDPKTSVALGAARFVPAATAWTARADQSTDDAAAVTAPQPMVFGSPVSTPLPPPPPPPTVGSPAAVTTPAAPVAAAGLTDPAVGAATTSMAPIGAASGAAYGAGWGDSATVPIPIVPSGPPPRRRSRRRAAAIGALVVVLAAAAAGAAFAIVSSGDDTSIADERSDDETDQESDEESDSTEPESTDAPVAETTVSTGTTTVPEVVPPTAAAVTAAPPTTPAVTTTTVPPPPPTTPVPTTALPEPVRIAELYSDYCLVRSTRNVENLDNRLRVLDDLRGELIEISGPPIDGWYYVRYDGTVGYLWGAFVKPPDPLIQLGETYDGNTAPVRSTSGDPIDISSLGDDKVVIVGVAGPDYVVILPDGRDGLVPQSAIRLVV